MAAPNEMMERRNCAVERNATTERAPQTTNGNFAFFPSDAFPLGCVARGRPFRHCVRKIRGRHHLGYPPQIAVLHSQSCVVPTLLAPRCCRRSFRSAFPLRFGLFSRASRCPNQRHVHPRTPAHPSIHPSIRLLVSHMQNTHTSSPAPTPSIPAHHPPAPPPLLPASPPVSADPQRSGAGPRASRPRWRPAPARSPGARAGG